MVRVAGLLGDVDKHVGYYDVVYDVHATHRAEVTSVDVALQKGEAESLRIF